MTRLHDFDALRAFAMLLGIALHAGMSFTGYPWPAQDLRPNGLFTLFFALIHGFRMPLFMLVSGFFTMMLWRRRGLSALLKQRFQRVVIPCVLGLLTVVPALHWASTWASQHAALQDARRRGTEGARTELAQTVRSGDLAGLEQLLASGADPDQADADFGVPALGWAALQGDVQAARLLLDKGARVSSTDRSGYSALHSAAFLGHAEVAELLIERGADPAARGGQGERPMDSTKSIATTARAGLAAGGGYRFRRRFWPSLSDW